MDIWETKSKDITIWQQWRCSMLKKENFSIPIFQREITLFRLWNQVSEWLKLLNNHGLKLKVEYETLFSTQKNIIEILIDQLLNEEQSWWKSLKNKSHLSQNKSISWVTKWMHSESMTLQPENVINIGMRCEMLGLLMKPIFQTSLKT